MSSALSGFDLVTVARPTKGIGAGDHHALDSVVGHRVGPACRNAPLVREDQPAPARCSRQGLLFGCGAPVEIVTPVGQSGDAGFSIAAIASSDAAKACELLRRQSTAGCEALHQGSRITDRRWRCRHRCGWFRGRRGGLLYPMTGPREGIGREWHAAAFLGSRNQLFVQIDAGRPEVGGGLANKGAVVSVLARVTQRGEDDCVGGQRMRAAHEGCQGASLA